MKYNLYLWVILGVLLMWKAPVHEAGDCCSTVTCPSGNETKYEGCSDNCHSFCQCDNGIPKLRDCAQGTCWNNTIPACDHTENGCQYQCPLSFWRACGLVLVCPLLKMYT
jgi:hypothetical protein